MDRNFLRFRWNSYKLFNLLLLVIIGGFLWFFPAFMRSGGCVADWCTYEVRSGILEPLYTSLQYFIFVPLVLLILPPRYFRRWLWYVASWAIPLSVLLVSTTSVYSSGILGGRSTDAILTTVALIILSVIAVIFFIMYDIWHWYRVSHVSK